MKQWRYSILTSDEGELVVTIAGMDAMEHRKISCPCRESNLDRPACSLSPYRLSYPSSKTIFVKDSFNLTWPVRSSSCWMYRQKRRWAGKRARSFCPRAQVDAQWSTVQSNLIQSNATILGLNAQVDEQRFDASNLKNLPESASGYSQPNIT
jgi:hypothetical protein